MYLRGPGLPEQGDNLLGGGAPDDGIVHHYHPLARHTAGQRPQLDAHRLFPALLAGGDEGAANVAVFHQAHPVGDAGLLSKAHGGVQSGVGHADDHVRLHGELPGQQPPGVAPGQVHRLAAQH